VRHPALGTVVFFVAAPGATAGLVPWLLTGWEGSPAGWDTVDLLGVLVGLVGLAMVVACFVRFVREGRGTPAPTAPTEELVVGGLYRYLRNPMYVGVGLAIAGQCLAFRSLSLVVWLALFTVAVTVFVVAYEQPTLRARYGAAYDAYCRRVPAVVPRLRRPSRGRRGPIRIDHTECGQAGAHGTNAGEAGRRNSGPSRARRSPCPRPRRRPR
jgi:protein-S-isoprenylcysteine O-methyltransferase Ste14